MSAAIEAMITVLSAAISALALDTVLAVTFSNAVLIKLCSYIGISL